MVSCSDLLFTQTVWRSSKDALVGFFPRLHNDNRCVRVLESIILLLITARSDQAIQEMDSLRTGEQVSTSRPATTKFSYLGLRDVLWTSSYSLLLSSGVMLKKEYLQVRNASNSICVLCYLCLLLYRILRSPQSCRGC
jgi:hypothetical protein